MVYPAVSRLPLDLLDGKRMEQPGTLNLGSEDELLTPDRGTGDYGRSVGRSRVETPGREWPVGRSDRLDPYDFCHVPGSSLMRFPSVYDENDDTSDGDECDVRDALTEELSDDQYQITCEPGREQWYESPYDPAFRKSFACLTRRKALAKKYLLEMLNPCEGEEPPPLNDLINPHAVHEASYALTELCLPTRHRTGVEKLSDILIKYPSLDLRTFLVDMDVFTIAYVIWGLDFYMNQKCFNFMDDDSDADIDTSENASRLTQMVTDTLKTSCAWLCTTISSIFSNVL